MKGTPLPRAVLAVALTTGLLLLVPLLAMRFTGEMSWSAGDFVAAGALVFIAGMALVLGTRRARTRRGRAAVAVAVILVFLAVWAELAVGLFH